ncbi:MAG: hypothetical protein PVSMB8_16570 [Vulcanimicrobiaceae bacterium]
MVLAPSSLRPTADLRRINVAKIALVVFALLAVATRMAEIPGHPLVLLRSIVSLVAIAFVVYGPAATFGRRAIAVVALEAIVGISMFALIDVPFVLDHQHEIGVMTLAAAEQLEAVQRAGYIAGH